MLIPRKSGFRFKCLGKECKKCCTDLFIKYYVKCWADKNNIYYDKNKKNCVFLNKNHECIIYDNKPLYCNLYPVIKVNKKSVILSDNCPGVGKGKYYSVSEWIKDAKTKNIEPGVYKTIIINNVWSRLIVLVSLILCFSLIPYSLFLLIYPCIWTYFFFKNTSLNDDMSN